MSRPVEKVMASVTGGWGEEGCETDCREAACQSSEQFPNSAPNLSRPVHLGMMASDQLQRKNRSLRSENALLDSVCWLTSPSENFGNSYLDKTSDLIAQCLYIRLLG
jgi:hypothetical protein